MEQHSTDPLSDPKKLSEVSQILFSALQQLQSKRGNKEGCYFLEIVVEDFGKLLPYEEEGYTWYKYSGLIFDLVVQDKVYLDRDAIKFSAVPLEGYRLWSQIELEDLKGLKYNAQALRLDNLSAPTVNFHSLRSIFLSPPSESSPSKEDYESKVSLHKTVFLDGQPLSRVGLASYPRSGNSMFRGLFEKTSGVVTGTDMVPDSLADLHLMGVGIKGEGVATDETWISKTHFPIGLGNVQPQLVSRVIMLVRNPLESIFSRLCIQLTQTHSLRIGNDLNKDFPNWEMYAFSQLQAWSDFSKLYVRLAKEKKVPIFFIRYEDAVKDQVNYLKAAYAFSLAVENIQGTYIEQRIDTIMKEQESHIYKRNAKKANKYEGIYTADQMKRMFEAGKEMLDFFGYALDDPNSFDPVKVLPLDEKSEFMQLNKEQIEWNIKGKEAIEKNTYKFYNEADLLPPPFDVKAALKGRFGVFRLQEV